MFKWRMFLVLLMMTLLLSLQSCKGSESNQKGLEYQTVSEIKDVKPEKPIRVKLKRDKNGEYSWEISGEDVDRIIETDKRIRGSVKE
ncbi:MAG: hypothetical protein Fur0020_00090 [Thermodesulfovibrionia bacterium]